MQLEHIAIWTKQLETLREFYMTYFHGVAGPKYHNAKKGFQSYFLSFGNGARIEIMSVPSVQSNKEIHPGNPTQGLTHLAFEVENSEEVDRKYHELRNEGFPVLDGPRMTGDGYYEFTTLDPDGNRIEVTCRMI
jgi:lactoylglutathione lyase